MDIKELAFYLYMDKQEKEEKEKRGKQENTQPKTRQEAESTISRF